jgi:hypothetical protein
MSEGDPYKRLKISEDQEIKTSEDANLLYQNACLSSRLKDQRKQISELTSLNQELTIKINKLEDTMTNFNCNWAKVLIK